MTGKGKQPEFDFDKFDYYPSNLVTEQIVWPLVDMAGGVDDWRQASDLDKKAFQYSDLRKSEEGVVEATILAKRFENWQTNGLRAQHIAQIIVGEYFRRSQDEDRHELILNNLKAHVLERHEDLDMASDRVGRPAWPPGIEDNATIGIERAYVFDDIGLVDREVNRIIKSDWGERWVFPADNKNNAYDNDKELTSSPVSINHMQIAHLKDIELACDVLKPSRDITDNLSHLINHPVSVI